MRILVADNDIANRNIIIDFFNNLGYKTEEALSSNDVIRLCRDRCPDLIFIDMRLSGVSGIDVVKQVRGLGGRAVWNPIVLMGADVTPQQLQEGIAAGADDFFIKPVDLIRLEYKLRSAIRQEYLKEQVFSVAHDLVLANRALENVVNKDALTGIDDLNVFHRALETEWYNARNNRTGLALIIIGLDCFKSYNAIYGVAQGDTKIKEIVAILLGLLSKEAKFSIARTVGESFSILLPGIQGSRAFTLAEDIIMAIEALQIPHGGSQCSEFLTASAGVSAIEQEQFTNPLELMEAADYALYQAKHKGRNRVYFENPEEIKS